MEIPNILLFVFLILLSPHHIQLASCMLPAHLNRLNIRDIEPYLPQSNDLDIGEFNGPLDVPSTPYADEFGLRGKWLGADTTFSITHLDDPNVNIWSFQDTLIGLPGMQDRTQAAWIGNSLGISRVLEDGTWNFTYYWHNTNGLMPFFNDSDVADPVEKLWPQQSYFYKDVLYFIHVWIEKTEGGNSWVTKGSKISYVRNWRDDPMDWVMTYKLLIDGGNGLGDGSVYNPADGFMYMWGTSSNYTQCLARLRMSDMMNPSLDLLQYSTLDGWKQGYDYTNCVQFPFDAASGLTVRWLPSINRWLALFAHFSYPYPSQVVSISTAENLTGPWSYAMNVFKYPELSMPAPCYAAYEHPQFNNAPESSVLFMYTCNGPTLPLLYTMMDVYHPVAYQVSNINWPTATPANAIVPTSSAAPTLPPSADDGSDDDGGSSGSGSTSNRNSGSSSDGESQGFFDKNQTYIIIAAACAGGVLILVLILYIVMRVMQNKKKKAALERHFLPEDRNSWDQLAPGTAPFHNSSHRASETSTVSSSPNPFNSSGNVLYNGAFGEKSNSNQDRPSLPRRLSKKTDASKEYQQLNSPDPNGFAIPSPPQPSAQRENYQRGMQQFSPNPQGRPEGPRQPPMPIRQNDPFAPRMSEDDNADIIGNYGNSPDISPHVNNGQFPPNGMQSRNGNPQMRPAFNNLPPLPMAQRSTPRRVSHEDLRSVQPLNLQQGNWRPPPLRQENSGFSQNSSRPTLNRSGSTPSDDSRRLPMEKQRSQPNLRNVSGDTTNVPPMPPMAQMQQIPPMPPLAQRRPSVERGRGPPLFTPFTEPASAKQNLAQPPRPNQNSYSSNPTAEKGSWNELPAMPPLRTRPPVREERGYVPPPQSNPNLRAYNTGYQTNNSFNPNFAPRPQGNSAQFRPMGNNMGNQRFNSNGFGHQ